MLGTANLYTHSGFVDEWSDGGHHQIGYAANSLKDQGGEEQLAEDGRGSPRMIAEAEVEQRDEGGHVKIAVHRSDGINRAP